jgi:hypothetical protein
MVRTNIDNEKISPESSQPPQSGQPPQPPPEQAGQTEAIKETVKESEKNISKFENIIEGSSRELYRTKAVFPFDLFPDEVIIDMNKVNIIKKIFFFTQRVHGVFIQDITDIFVSTAPFFATLEIIDSGFIENSIKIPFLKIDDALKARRIIQGLIVAKKQAIDLSGLKDDKDLTTKLEALGESKRV